METVGCEELVKYLRNLDIPLALILILTQPKEPAPFHLQYNCLGGDFVLVNTVFNTAKVHGDSRARQQDIPTPHPQRVGILIPLVQQPPKRPRSCCFHAPKTSYN